MLTHFHVRGFRCIQQEVKLALTPLHALIGPNDSGKSTILQAIARASTALSQPDPTFGFTVVCSDGTTFRRGPPLDETWHPPGDPVYRAGQPPNGPIGPVQIVRFDPDALRQPSALVPDGAPLRLQERGEGLAGVLDEIMSRGDETWSAMRKRFEERFPGCQLYLAKPSNQTKAPGLRLADGTTVPASQMSEGMLYFLAFEALACVVRPAIFLVEEPENGLHPARIADVVRTLRAITTHAEHPAQVIIATHSPLVVNELEPSEVTVVTRDPRDGTKVQPLAKTPHFDERREVYALGELWLAYADGRDEAPLLQASAP